ncbi:MAG TPA: hypothetical protein PLH37_03480 [bacterium]|nr:hypothetical protein [bacterium]
MPRFEQNLNTLAGFGDDLDAAIARHLGTGGQEKIRRKGSGSISRTRGKEKNWQRPDLPPEGPPPAEESPQQEGLSFKNVLKPEANIDEIEACKEIIQNELDAGSKDEQAKKQREFAEQTEALGLESVNRMIAEVEASENPDLLGLARLYLQREYLESYEPNKTKIKNTSSIWESRGFKQGKKVIIKWPSGSEDEVVFIGFPDLSGQVWVEYNNGVKGKINLGEVEVEDVYGRKPKKDYSQFTGQVGSLLNTQAGAVGEPSSKNDVITKKPEFEPAATVEAEKSQKTWEEQVDLWVESKIVREIKMMEKFGLDKFFEARNNQEIAFLKEKYKNDPEQLSRELKNWEKIMTAARSEKKAGYLIRFEAEKRVREKIVRVLPKIFSEFAVHGTPDFRSKAGERKIGDRTDLDGQACLGLLKMVGFDVRYQDQNQGGKKKKKNVTFVDYSDEKYRLPNTVHVDSILYDGVALLQQIDGALDTIDLIDERKIIARNEEVGVFWRDLGVLIDHHPTGAPSAAGMVFKLLDKLGFLQKFKRNYKNEKTRREENDYIKMLKMIEFIDLIDSAGYQEYGKPEHWPKAHKTFLGLHKTIRNFSNVWKFFNETDGDWNRELSDDELKKYGFIHQEFKNGKPIKTINESEKLQKTLENVDVWLEKSKQEGKIIETNLGPVVVNLDDGGYYNTAIAQKIGAGYLKWDTQHKTFFLFSNVELDENLFNKEQNQGLRVRGHTWVVPIGVGETGLTLGKVLERIGAQVEPGSKLEEFLKVESAEQASSTQLTGKKHVSTIFDDSEFPESEEKPKPITPEDSEPKIPEKIPPEVREWFEAFKDEFPVGSEAYFSNLPLFSNNISSYKRIKIVGYQEDKDNARIYLNYYEVDDPNQKEHSVKVYDVGDKQNIYEYSYSISSLEEMSQLREKLKPRKTTLAVQEDSQKGGSASGETPEPEKNNPSPEGESSEKIDLVSLERGKKIDEYLDAMYAENERARAQLDKRSERIFSRIEQNWQWFNRLNLDTLLKNHNIDIDEWKPTNKPLKVAKFLAKGVLKNAFSLKTVVGLSILGLGVLEAGGATAFFAAAKAGEMSALGFLMGRGIVSGFMSGSAILFGGEVLKKQKAKKRLEEIQKMVEDDTIFQKSGSELSQLIAEYQFASALMGIKLENDDPVYNTMVSTNADIILEQIRTEENLGAIDYFVEGKIIQADLALEKQFAKSGEKRAARVAVATAVATFVATGLPGKAMAKAWGFALDQVGLGPDSSSVSEVIGSGQDKGGSAIFENQSGGTKTADQIIESQSETNIPRSNSIEKVVESRGAIGTQQAAEQVSSAPQEVRPPIAESGIKLHPHETYIGQRIDALVDENDQGVISVLRRQLEAHPEKFGYTGKPGAAMHEWAEQKANNIAFNKGYGDVLVKEPGKFSYILEAQKDAGGKIDYNIHEVDYQSGQELDLNAGKLNPYEYPATPKTVPIEAPADISPTPTIADLYPARPKIEVDNFRPGLTRVSIDEVNNFLKAPNFDASGAIINSEKETGFIHAITEATRNYVKGADSREVDLFARHIVDNPKILGNGVSPESLKGSFLNFREQAHSYELPSPDKHFWQPRMLFHADGQHSMINVRPVKGGLGTGYALDYGGDIRIVSPSQLEDMITPIRVVENCYDSNINPGTKLSALIKAIEDDRSFTHKGNVFSKSNGHLFFQAKGRGTPIELTHNNVNKLLGLKPYKPNLSAALAETSNFN